ncbi:Panacea domain-containing protein [Candidatus Avelusimicrobium alvi]|uniref:Panacea domain-containing protein n=1 Tax=Candidatus Avelusimicrobium alvi TaxID=3416221 RepID=UPI003D0C5F7B
MANIFDVAKYILKKIGPITAMKLQKLCYYSQAWHLVWEEKPLFSNKIEAWGKGPVSPELYKWHKGQFIVNVDEVLNKLAANKLSSEEKSSIDAVLKGYGKYTAQELSDMTHREEPWKAANSLCPVSGNCTAEITIAAMHEYYSSIGK